MAFLDENGLAELWKLINEWGISNDTKMAYSVGDKATPAEIFNKIKNEILFGYTWLERSAIAPVLMSEPSTWNMVCQSTHYGVLTYNVQYADSYEIASDGTLALVNPTEATYSYSDSSIIDTLKGKYVAGGNLDNPSLAGITADIVYVGTDASFSTRHDSSQGMYWGYLTNVTALKMDAFSYGEYSYKFSDNIEAYPTEKNAIVGDSAPMGTSFSGKQYEFVGSVAKNSMAYYQMNTEAVLNALLGLEDNYGL